MIGMTMGGSKLPLEKYLLRFDPPKPAATTPEDSKAIWMAAMFPQKNPDPVYTSTEKIIP